MNFNRCGQTITPVGIALLSILSGTAVFILNDMKDDIDSNTEMQRENQHKITVLQLELQKINSKLDQLRKTQLDQQRFNTTEPLVAKWTLET